MENRVTWWMVALGVVVVGLLAWVFVALASDEPESSTTTTPMATTSSVEATTSAPVQTTTSSLAETTTTVAETTTTADDGLLEGNWAPQPLIASGMGALGWWDGGAWVQVEEGTELPASGGEDYQIVRYGVEAIAAGAIEEVGCGVTDMPGVTFDDPGVLDGGVAISAPWALTPHLVEAADDDGTYAAVAAELLAERGLDVPEPIIKQVYLADLDGDGINEVVVVAEDVPEALYGEVGDYSIAFMQQVAGDEVNTIVFGESVIVEVEEGSFGFLVSFEIPAIADLSGDGQMEIVLNAGYYEGRQVEVLEYVGDEVGLQAQVGAVCGV